MSSFDHGTGRAARMQARADETMERWAGSAVEFQRVLAALGSGSASPGDLSRLGQHSASDVYQRLTAPQMRFLWRSVLLSSAYCNDYLWDVLPPHRRPEVGEPPTVPHPPTSADPSEWSAWYLLYTTAAMHQQVWMARVLQVLRDEAEAGGLSPEEAQRSGQAFLRERMTDYLGDLAEIGMDLMADGVSAVDESLRGLSEGLGGATARSQEITVEVSGRAGTTASTDLAIENNQAQQADVVCAVSGVEGITLTVVPARFRLAPGQTERVSVRVALPDAATPIPAPAGTIEVSGYGDEPLIVRVLAKAEPDVKPAVTIRALDAFAEPAS